MPISAIFPFCEQTLTGSRGEALMTAPDRPFERIRLLDQATVFLSQSCGCSLATGSRSLRVLAFRLLWQFIVTGEPEKRAEIASALCYVANRENIPIYPGAAKLLLVPQHQQTASQHEAVKTWDRKTGSPQEKPYPFFDKRSVSIPARARC